MSEYLSSSSKHSFWAKISFFVAFIAFLLFFTHLKPRIMVIHSLSENNPWVKNFNLGLENSLKIGKTAPLSFQYLEAQTKLSELSKLKISVLTRQALERFNPHILILCGSEAQELIGKNYINDPHKKILFCGLRGTLEDHGYEEARNVTGIFEQLPLKAFKELIPLLIPNPPSEPLKLVFLGDNSSLSKSFKKTFAAQNWAPFIFIDLVTVNTFEEWKTAVQQLSQKGHLLFISEYKQIYRDENLTTLRNPQEILKWTQQNSTLPTIGLSDFFVQDGGMLALTVSPVGQGKAIALLAQDLLKGKAISTLPPLYNQDFLVRLNPLTANKLSSLPAIYTAFDHGLTQLD